MSRTLSRLRDATGDPLLVRAGRGLAPTPRALVLRDEAARVVETARSLLRPDRAVDLASLDRTFTLRANEGFVEVFGPALVNRVATEAAGVRLRFAPKADKDVTPLRKAAIDLEIGVAGVSGPEVRVQTLFRDVFIGVVRKGHALASGPMTPERFAAGKHISVSRRGAFQGPIDEALLSLGLRRSIAAITSSFPAALAIARQSDLVANVPERQTTGLRNDLKTFRLPVETPEVAVSQLWHPRFDADPGHQWLRQCVRDVCCTSPQS